MDVVVVGCGVVGLFVAYELRRRGLEVAVVDGEPEPGWGVSRRHAGVIHAVQLPFGSYKARLMRRGNTMYREVCGRLGVPCREVRALLAVDSPFKLPLLLPAYLYLRAHGVKASLCLRCRAEGVRNVRGAVVVEGYMVVDSFRLLYALYDSLRAAGVRFHMGCRALDVEEGDDGVVLRTTCGELKAGYAVNAAGLYADELAARLGVRRPIRPGKGVMAVYAGEVGAIVAPLSLRRHPRTKGGAIVPTAYGTTLVGPTFAEAADKEDRSASRGDLEALERKFGRFLAGPRPLLKLYVGNRPLSPSGDVELVATRRTVHVIGTESPLFTGAPALAQDVAAALERMGLRPRGAVEVPPPPPYPRRGRVVCPCTGATEGEVREAVRRGSRTLDGVMARLGIGMGPCQASRCMAEVLAVVADELGVPPSSVTKFGGGSWLVR